MVVFIALIIAFLIVQETRSILLLLPSLKSEQEKQRIGGEGKKKGVKAPIHTDHTGWEMSVTPPPPSKESQIKQWQQHR